MDKVGQLVLLPNTGYATTESLANFYRVPVNTIRKLSERHKEELEEDGHNVFSRKEFQEIYNKHFGLTRYCHLPCNRFHEALDWLEAQSNNSIDDTASRISQ